MSLVLHFKMNDDLATTNVIDSAGSNDGIFDVNTEDRSVVGKINKALNFIPNNYINLGVNADFDFDSGDFTITGWLKITAITFPDGGTNWHLFHSESYRTSGWLVRVAGDTGKLLLRTNQSGTDQSSICGTAFNNNTWYHFAMVKEGTSCKFYIDGEFKANDVSGTHTNPVAASIDSKISRSSQAFDGLLDDIRIYDLALTLLQIKAIYNNGRGTELAVPSLPSMLGANF